MTTVHLPSQLRDIAGDASLSLEGTDVREIISNLERRHPRVVGWVRDERGQIRRHIKIFVNGEEADLDAAVADADEIRILPAISGGGE